MPVPDHQAAANRKLTHWLTNERRVVTYRDLSRELRCHVNVAKNLLRSYSLQQQTSSTPTYLLTGPLRATAELSKTALDSLSSQAGPATQMVRIVDMDEVSDAERNSEDGQEQEQEQDDQLGVGVGIGSERVVGNDEGDEDGIGGGVNLEGIKREDEDIQGEQVQRWGCVLVQQDKIDEKKTLFEDDKVCVTIYSLSPVPIKDPAQYLVPILALRSHDRYRDPATYGTITGSAFKASEGSEKKIMRDGGIDFSKGAVKVARGGGSKAEEGRKQGIKEEVRKQGIKEEVKKDQSPVPNPEPEIPKPSAKEKQQQKPKPSHTHAKKRDKDKESDDDTQTLGVKSDPLVEPTSSMNRADDKAAMEAMMGMDDDLDMDLGDDALVKQEPDSETEDEPKASGSKIRANAQKHPKKEHGVRKKRKVKKSKTEVDEKGYMVTKDYYSEESYSGESEPDEESQSKTKKSTKASEETDRKKSLTTTKSTPPPPKKPATGNGGPAAGKAAAGGTGSTSLGKGRGGGQMSLQGFFKKK